MDNIFVAGSAFVYIAGTIIGLMYAIAPIAIWLNLREAVSHLKAQTLIQRIHLKAIAPNIQLPPMPD